ncbi:nitroreductase/quinone reductase family protein [Nonomuraea purpurea]|uniref:Nitroreductase/quinone reductase family protein n=1 Tax=Nonomuraea purpurea TaxID=1849276 RepID=A0ABV8G8L8_9ACTN
MTARIRRWPERFAARARTAEGQERERLWRKMTTLAPTYLTYQAKTQDPRGRTGAPDPFHTRAATALTA